MEQRSSSRQLTGARVSAILSACIIPNEGSNKFYIVGRGNPYTREDGTAVRIFNVQAFASHDDSNEAGRLFKEGYKIEKSGNLDGAQQYYKDALNKMMNFSVTEQNAAAFQSADQITGLVQQVEKRDGGTKLGINRPKPVVITASGASTAHLFELPVDDVKAGSAISDETIKAEAKPKPTLDKLNK